MATDRRKQDFLGFPAIVANITGGPAMSVPLYWSSAGLPIGVHFLGRYGDDATLFRLAAQLEAARPWARRDAAFLGQAIGVPVRCVPPGARAHARVRRPRPGERPRAPPRTAHVRTARAEFRHLVHAPTVDGGDVLQPIRQTEPPRGTPRVSAHSRNAATTRHAAVPAASRIRPEQLESLEQQPPRLVRVPLLGRHPGQVVQRPATATIMTQLAQQSRPARNRLRGAGRVAHRQARLPEPPGPNSVTRRCSWMRAPSAANFPARGRCRLSAASGDSSAVSPGNWIGAGSARPRGPGRATCSNAARLPAQLQRRGQTPRGIPGLRPAVAALQVLDRAQTQLGALGELVLGQAGS